VTGPRVAAAQQHAAWPPSELRWPEYANYQVGETIRCAVLRIDTAPGTVLVSERKLNEHDGGGADEGAE
jgi:hypothetical protein